MCSDMALQEKERRRQHLLVVKAMEARRKQEDKERVREQRRNEKRVERELKIVSDVIRGASSANSKS